MVVYCYICHEVVAEPYSSCSRRNSGFLRKVYLICIPICNCFVMGSKNSWRVYCVIFGCVFRSFTPTNKYKSRYFMMCFCHSFQTIIDCLLGHFHWQTNVCSVIFWCVFRSPVSEGFRFSLVIVLNLNANLCLFPYGCESLIITLIQLFVWGSHIRTVIFSC